MPILVRLKTFAALLLGLCMPSVNAQSNMPQAVILQYHHISSSTPRSTSVTAEEFKAHMEYLRDHGFTVMPLPDVIHSLREGQPLPEKPAVITFDDAYISVYETAFPLLQAYGWPFTVFVPSGLVGSNPRLYTSWEQLREMAAAGATLANHSISHPYFLEAKPGESESQRLARVEHEIVDAEIKIQSETGQSHKLHAYPYGEYDSAVQGLLDRLGYVGIGQHSGPINASSNFLALPRFPFSGIYAPVRTFAPKVESLAFQLSVIDPASPVTSTKRPEAVLEFSAEYRFKDLACYLNDRPMEVSKLTGERTRYRIKPLSDGAGRRFRYNCTAPGHDGRYYWYSVPWINPALPDG